MQVFLRCLRDPNRVSRIENLVPKISENYHLIPRIREVGSLQVHTGYLAFSLKKTALCQVVTWKNSNALIRIHLVRVTRLTPQVYPIQ